jgi:hypothetical protein
MANNPHEPDMLDNVLLVVLFVLIAISIFSFSAALVLFLLWI